MVAMIYEAVRCGVGKRDPAQASHSVKFSGFFLFAAQRVRESTSRCAMKTKSSTILRHFCVAAVVAIGLSNSAWATIQTLSNIIQYGSENTYYQYASLKDGGAIFIL